MTNEEMKLLMERKLKMNIDEADAAWILAGVEEQLRNEAAATHEGSYCPKGHLLFSDGMCPRCERFFPLAE